MVHALPSPSWSSLAAPPTASGNTVAAGPAMVHALSSPTGTSSASAPTVSANVAGAIAGTVHALTTTTDWTGLAGDLQWTTTGNWDNGVPTASADAVITLSGTYTITVHGAAAAHSMTLGGASGTQTLDIQGSGAGNALLTTSANSTINTHGLLELSSANGNSATYTQSSGTLTDSGTIQSDSANGGGRSLNGVVTNSSTGSISTSGIGLSSDSSTAVTNQGAVSLTNGVWTISGGSFNNQTASASVTGSGSGELFVLNGSFTQGSGTSSTNPMVVQGGTLTYTGTGSSDSITALAGVNVAGTIASGESLNIQGSGAGNATATAGASFTNHGAIQLSSTNGNSATFTQSSGTFTNTGSFTVSPNNGGGRTFVNNATVDLVPNSTFDLSASAAGLYQQGTGGTLLTTTDGTGNFGELVTTTANLAGAVGLAGGSANLPNGTALKILDYGSHIGPGFSTFSFADQPFTANTGPTSVTLVLGPANVQVSVVPVNPTIVTGNPATILVTVAPGIGPGTPSGGPVQLVVDGTNYGSPQPLGVGPLTFMVTGLAVGTHTVSANYGGCLLYTSPSPRDRQKSRMPSSA